MHQFTFVFVRQVRGIKSTLRVTFEGPDLDTARHVAEESMPGWRLKE